LAPKPLASAFHESPAFSGGYAASPVLSLDADKNCGIVKNTQATSSAGTVSTPVKFTLSGNAVFNATGTSVLQNCTLGPAGTSVLRQFPGLNALPAEQSERIFGALAVIAKLMEVPLGSS